MSVREAARKARVSQKKAKIILEHGEVRGHPLTPAQRGYFGWIAGGSKPRKGEK
jgi:hypothetical protein